MNYNSNINADVFTSSTAHGQLCCGYFSVCMYHRLNEAPTPIAPSLSFQIAEDMARPDQVKSLDNKESGISKAKPTAVL